MKAKDVLKLEALSLHVGDSTNTVLCPFCPPGKAEKGAFRLARSADGILYTCYRAKCGSSGFIPTSGSSMPPHARKDTFTPKYFHRPLRRLPVDIRRWLKSRYRIEADSLVMNEVKYDYVGNCLHYTLFNYMGHTIGEALKRLPRELATDKADLSLWRYLSKGSTYWHNDVPRCTYVKGAGWNSNGIAIVEDFLSGMRVAEHCRAMSLLSTNLSDSVVQELTRRTDTIYLMLDADTWDRPGGEALPIRLQKKYGLYFKNFRLIKIDKDPKDMSHEELKGLNLL